MTFTEEVAFPARPVHCYGHLLFDMQDNKIRFAALCPDLRMDASVLVSVFSFSTVILICINDINTFPGNPCFGCSEWTVNVTLEGGDQDRDGPAS